MDNSLNMAAAIDAENYKFTSHVKSILSDLSNFSDAALDWLMMEHYQFSFRNTGFLSKAAETARGFETGAVEAELLRNYNEERGHARMYKRALRKMGTDVERRQPFAPTAAFFERIDALISADAWRMLGAMYATETAAIFEHEVFWDISREVAARRGHAWEGSELKAFHDLHLNGVEQSHKDELGVFLKDGSVALDSTGGDDRDRSVRLEKAHAGGLDAIAAMDAWWSRLLAEMPNAKSPDSATVPERTASVESAA